MNNDNKNQEKLNDERAGQQTAQTLVKGGLTAAGAYVGGPVGARIGNKVGNKLNNSRLGQGITNAAGKVIGNTPVVNKLNKGLNDTGAIDAADKAVDMAAGKGLGKGLKKGKKGNKKNLSNSKLNKGTNGDSSGLPNALQNKNHNQGMMNRFLSKSSSNSNTEDKQEADTDNSDNIEENNSSSILDGKSSSKILLRKYMPAIIGIVASVAMILIILLVIIEIISPVLSFFGIEMGGTGNGNNSSYIYSSVNEPELSKAEIEYNEALLKIIDDYKDKYGVTIDKFLLHATVSYRYLTESMDKMYASDSEITDEDLENALDRLETEIENTSEESDENKVDYSAAAKKIAVVAALMIQNNGDGTYSTDKEKGGIFYNNLVQSSFLTSYYKDFLKDNSEETKKRLVDDIFDYAELAREIVVEDKISNSNVISNQSIVYLQVCKNGRNAKKHYQTKTINGIEVYDNKLVNEGTQYPLYLSIRDYIKGVLMAEIGSSVFTEKYKEYVKLQTILALNFMLGDSRSGFNLKTGELYFPTQTCRQVTCDPTYGCTTVDTVGSFTSLNRKIDTSYYGSHKTRNIPALTTTQNEYLDEIFDEVFGLVLAKPGVTAETLTKSSDLVSINFCSRLVGVCPSCHKGSCVGQLDAKADAESGMSYIEILKKYIYSNGGFELVNISEGLYYETTENYEGQVKLNYDFYYNQGLYRNTTICSGEGSLKTYGCSIMSTAIAVSLLTGEKHDPIEVNSKLKTTGNCGGSGDRFNNMVNGAKLYNLQSYKVNKGDKQNINRMLSDLSSGNSVVVARIAPNEGQGARYNTKNGHYIVLVGTKTVDGRTKVLVWDPGNKAVTRHDYWADFETDIEKWVNISPSYVVIHR